MPNKIVRYCQAGIRYLTDKNYRFLIHSTDKKFQLMDDESYLKLKFRATMGYDLDLNNPRTFNEKLQWLKLYDRRAEYTQMVDKYLVREIVTSTIGEEYLIPLLGVWDNPDEIPFDKLPNQFVLKCNHNSGTGMCICRDKSKLELAKVKGDLCKGLAQDYYISGREWPYKNVPRKIICEKYMEDTTSRYGSINNHGLNDYKFFCFNGKVKFFKVDFDRFIEHHANYYSPEGRLLDFGEADYPPKPERKLVLPSNLKEMEHLAELLAKNYPFLRVDFYSVNGKIYFGELTLFPTSGFGRWTDEKYDLKIGNLLQLPLSNEGIN